MKYWIVAFGLLFGCLTAVADKPRTSGEVNDIVELRESIGESEAFATDRQQFAEALQQQFAEPRNQPYPSDWNAPPNADRGSDPRLEPQAWPPRQVVDSSSWNQAYDGRPSHTAPHHPAPPRPPQAPRPRKHQLLHSAFELEKIAHQLEMADLGKEADAVRDAAEKLRKSARDSKDGKQGDAKDHGDKRDKREKQARQAAEAKLQQLKKALAQAEAAKAEAGRARRQADEARMMAERQRRRAEAAREAAQRQRQRKEASAKPPKGVHGGPRDGHDGSAGIVPDPR